MSVSLTWLLDGIAAVPANEARVADLTLDSREVRPGALFFALNGAASHGLRHAADAASRGASVVLWDPDGASFDNPLLKEGAAQAGAIFAAPIAGLRHLVGRIADRYFGCPSLHMRIVGITGTNGKTTCAYLVAQCLERLGRDAAYIGTVGWGRVGALRPATHTTPDAVQVHRVLSELRADGVHDVAMEVSSHALDQGRVDGVRFACAAFTNLTRDHLDYHGSMEAYGAAKARLLEMSALRYVVVNVGDPFGSALAHRLTARVPVIAIWVGGGQAPPHARCAVQGEHVVLGMHGISLELAAADGTRRVCTRLLGRYNAENALIVIGCLLALGATRDDAAAAIAQCRAPPGRMEVVSVGSDPKPLAVIDYAHTPDALAKALAALREHCRGALWCVFGCGGDRDAGKRPLMGEVADRLADRIIVTDDNPRSENPRSITHAIAAGIAMHPLRVIHDRSEAIGAALHEAAAADIVLIAGKGHEEYQIYGDLRRCFSDRREALRHLGAAA